ncbi:MAG: hypothetical protein WA418_27395 [Bradyrhizobium sp.]
MAAGSQGKAHDADGNQNLIARAQSREEYELAHVRSEVWMSDGNLWMISIANNLQQQD